MDFASSLLAIPVVDIDGTMFVQGGIYIALVVILGPLLFKPWLAAQARRVEAVDGALAKAKTMRVEADELARDYEERLDQARERAHGVRSDARHDEEATQAKTLAAARSEANDGLAEQRDRIAAETQQAREALGDRVDELAQEITTKLLGRAS
ncbi:MAG: ATP synthase F0 subunit B [Deltaproteobacteria bacterium]|nr:ATP synthase F0 subunit B [Deltaproteobacteria bacterium]